MAIGSLPPCQNTHQAEWRRLAAAIHERRVALTRFGSGLCASGVAQLLGAAQAFALVPLFLSAGGPDTYGAWVTVTAAVSYLLLMEGGGQNYFANGLGVAFARGDRSGFVRLLSEAVSLYAVLGVTAACCAIGILGAYRLGLIRVGGGWRLEVGCILAIHFLGLHIPRGVYSTVYRASRMFSVSAYLHNAFLITSTVLQAVVLLWKGRPVHVAIAMLLSNVIIWLWMIFDSRRRIPWCRDIQISLGHARQGLRHLRSSLGFWAISLAQTLSGPGMVLVLASREPARLVGLFATHRTLSSIASFVPSLIQAPVQPELTFLHGSQRSKELRLYSGWLVRGVTILTGLVAFFVLVTARVVYPAWSKGKYELHSGLLILLLVQGILAAGSSACTWPMMSANQHGVLVPWSIAQAVTSVVLCALILPRYGLMAPAIAGCATQFVLGWMINPLYASRFLEVPTRTMVRKMAEVTLGALGLVAMAAVLSRQ